MIYTVVWLPVADQQLINLWIHHVGLRNAITKATHEIGIELRTDPETKVVPCGKFWTLTIAPLAVLCYIDPGDCMVTVMQVRIA